MSRAGTDDTSMLAVFADPVTPELARTLDLAGYTWKAVASADEAADNEPADGWPGAIVDCTTDPEGAWAFARTIRKSDGSRSAARPGRRRPTRRPRTA